MNTYTYRVMNLRVIDGDTVECDIDLGFRLWLLKKRIRLSGIDAPETRTRDAEEKRRGLCAKVWLKERLSVNPDGIRLVTDEYIGKYGRTLGTFYSDGRNLNQAMLKAGLVNPYPGASK